MKMFAKFAAAAAIAIIPVQALADTGNVQFGATITHSCTIDQVTNGSLGANAGFNVLSSTVGSGTSGSARIVATGNAFNVSVSAPTLDKPAGDTTTETLVSSYSASGATSIASTSSQSDLNNGTTNVTVDMSATKAGADVFEAGVYTGEVVLTCE